MAEHPPVPPASRRADPRVVAAGGDQLEALITSAPSELVVAYFWGAGCPHCGMFAEHLPSLMARLGGAPVRLVKVDAYGEPALARRYGVHGVPQFVLFREGQRVARMSEFRSDAFWLDVVREHLPRPAP